MLTIRRIGRRHHYRVNLDVMFRHPTIEGIPLRTLLGGLNGHVEPRNADRRELVGAGMR